jgi:riboflavin kinase/FMN adenylyltransferase
MSTHTRAPMMRYPQQLPTRFRSGVATIGNFDGIHRGHQRVLKQLRAIAGARPTLVISFYPHPIRVLRPEAGLRYISSVREKAESCGALGVDLLYFVHFTSSMSQMSATDFIEKILVAALGISELVVGDDVRIGKNREGDLTFLQRTLPTYGIRLHIVDKLDIEGVKAGSRKIRELIEQGCVEAAQELIGEPFTISARVGHGDKRGSLLGFPTANIAVGPRLIPRRGVYACQVKIEDACFAAVANIGIRPTFNGSGERLEVHILDFPPRSLYGVRMHVGFVARLRDEKRFDSIEALKAQIALDVQAARERLAHVS